jgi:hypothetical protein
MIMDTTAVVLPLVNFTENGVVLFHIVLTRNDVEPKAFVHNMHVAFMVSV